MSTSKAALPADEIEDFERACFERSRDPKEFVVQAVERTPVNGGHIERTITVSCGEVSREYDGSSGTNWNVEFENDLSAQAFGTADN